MKTSEDDGRMYPEPEGTVRIATLSDGIFAIAMTLLVLTIQIPKIPADRAGAELPGYIYRLWPQLTKYFLAFITLAAFWMSHHVQFRHIRRSNYVFLWINILAMMLTALIPFTTDIVGDYGNVAAAARLFEFNLLLAGMAFYWQWTYACRHRLVSPGIDPSIIKKIRQSILIIPALSLIALVISAFTSRWSTSVYILIPFLYHRERLTHRLLPGEKEEKRVTGSHPN